MSDGRSYTAVSPLNSDVGYSSQLAYTFGYAIGWLFAKPVGSDAPNGYEVSCDSHFVHFKYALNFKHKHFRSLVVNQITRFRFVSLVQMVKIMNY